MKFKTFFASAALFMVLVLIFCACGKQADTPTTSDDADKVTTTSPLTEAESSEGQIALADLANYVLVRPEVLSDELSKACQDLRKLIQEKTGVTLTLKSDFYREGVATFAMSDYEILVGACDRDESRSVMENIKQNDYGYQLVGKKLTIYGGDEEAVIRAIQAFSAYLRANSDTENFYTKRADTFSAQEYEIDTLTLQGVPINQYRIVYPRNNSNSEKNLAELLAQRIASKTGYILEVVNDKDEPQTHEILVGTTNRTACALTGIVLDSGSYLCGARDGYVCLRGGDSAGIYYAVHGLLNMLFADAGKDLTVTLDAEGKEKMPELGDTLSAMSFNLKVASVTEQRQKSVSDTIFRYLPDTVGVQEASPSWMSYLTGQLSYLYGNAGLGRDGGSSGEHSAIFYRKDRFELVKTETKWMSDTPDKVSKFSESSLNRIYTYALLKIKSSGQQILVVNTHLDHKSDTARTKQIRVLLDGVAALQDQYGQIPVILTGDFNATTSTDVYTAATAVLKDSSTIAAQAERSYTFHDYGNAASLIDFVFVSPYNITVDKYRVVTEKENGMLPSDHYPLYIEYRLFR